MQHEQEDSTFGIKTSQKDSGFMQFLGNRSRFFSVYIISLFIILPGDPQGLQNITVS